MWALFNKEVKGFMSSLVGFIVMATFLLMSGLFIWIFPGELNILESGYADLASFFTIAPWVFLFLIPAITMRLFAEERRTGTLESLLTKPLTENQIITAKLMAGEALVLLSLLPTVIFLFTVYQLASPVGNVDMGGVLGSYIGLLLLSMAFVAVGTFASSITDNQIIAFIVAVVLSFFLHMGFDALGSFELFGSWDHFVQQLGINAHYRSLSRGVIDTRDVVYMLSITLIFFLFTKASLESRKW